MMPDIDRCRLVNLVGGRYGISKGKGMAPCPQKRYMEAVMKTARRLIVAVLIVLSSAATTLAASARCVVTEAEDNRLVLECERGTQEFTPGQEVKIKTERTSGAIEGC